MKILCDCKILPDDSGQGNSRPRLVFTGELWDEWDLEFCVHGEKLRWRCDACEEELDNAK